MALITDAIFKLRNDPRILKVPPYISLLCMLGGVIWILLLPLNQYSRQTYISENALLPGQVHTYFGGSEQNIFRAYKHEVASIVNAPTEVGLNITAKAQELVERRRQVSDKVEDLFQNAGLKTGRQRYRYQSSGQKYPGENVYAVLSAPRGDSTEAVVLVAALKNAEGNDNINGVALLVTLARYFKRWSLWSKDIIFLVTPDSIAGPQAWIDSYHSTHDPYTAQDLTLKSGALQGAVCFDYPLDHRFETLHIAYDGINGQLPNLDLFNTAVSIASGQMGIGTSIQGMHKHDDSYQKRLFTLVKGMSSQALGHATGPHSVFMPYHIDAITLTTIGEGWQDEMALGRTVESICRSLNNLLEHLHQSFFFYLLMQSNRFVSIGTYLPSAMAVAAGFTIMAIHLWVKSAQEQTAKVAVAEKSIAKDEKTNPVPSTPKDEPQVTPTLPTTTATTTTNRALLLPITLILTTHLLSLIPLYILTHLARADVAFAQILVLFGMITILAPIILASAIANMAENTYLPALAAPTAAQYTIIKSLSLLLLGLLLSTLATLNFSLSITLGLLCAPLAFVDRTPTKPALAGLQYLILAVMSPVGVLGGFVAYIYTHTGSSEVVLEMLEKVAFGWNVWGSWGVPVGVCCVWWPAWMVGAVLVASTWYADV